MVQYPELKTSLRQRISIIIIAVVLLGSTIALYAGIVMSYNNSGRSTTDSEKEARFQQLYEEYQAEVALKATELSGVYFNQFVGYKSNVKSFNAAAITDLSITDLKIGDGAEVADETFSDYSAYYIGWLSDETIFDSSLETADNPTSLKSPIPGGQMIEGWNQGIVGMKIGGVREISIPSELAYGEAGQGDIPANSPLKFIVMLIPRTEIAWSDEMNTLYAELYGNTPY